MSQLSQSKGTKMIVGFVGFISSGKDTAADYLVNSHGFRRDSFATALKDAVAAVFGWDRTLLEGRTAASRQWRDQIDSWWAQRLNIPHLTPRWVLQCWGTDVLRNNFNDDVWIAALENKMRKTTDDIVISDVRFPNEIQAIRQAGGKVFRIKRGIDPDWYEDARVLNVGHTNMTWTMARLRMENLQIHNSEWAWVGQRFDSEIDNNGTIDDLCEQIKSLVQDLPVAKANSGG
jgi:hypothetical protein